MKYKSYTGRGQAKTKVTKALDKGMSKIEDGMDSQWS